MIDFYDMYVLTWKLDILLWIFESKAAGATLKQSFGEARAKNAKRIAHMASEGKVDFEIIRVH